MSESVNHPSEPQVIPPQGPAKYITREQLLKYGAVDGRSEDGRSLRAHAQFMDGLAAQISSMNKMH